MDINFLPTKQDYDRIDQKLDEILNTIGLKNTVSPQIKNEGGIELALEILYEKAGINSKPTVYKWSHEGRIPCSKRGKKLWFNRMELELWIESGMPHVGQQKAANALAGLPRKRA